MRNGFIFNHNRCVGCNACVAGCMLENGWDIKPRMVYTFNSDVLPLQPLINFSLACNHCEKAVCLDGCPSAAYSRDESTGAVVIDDKNCIGCRYCQWNCPYDAPKFDNMNRVIGKCHLCYTGIIEGRMPSCSNACPTGALSFGDLTETLSEDIPSWFPDKNLNPAIKLTGRQDPIPLKIIPDLNKEAETQTSPEKVRERNGDWSLILFSFLSTISVSLIISSFLKATFPDLLLFISILALAGIFSLFHLGKALRAWRSLANIYSSPISREILLFIFYSLSSVAAIYYEMPAILIVSVIAGLLFLIAIDSVYFYVERNRSLLIHSGQTFISSLLIISFLTGNVLPFSFIALLKIGLSVYRLSQRKSSDPSFPIRFFRIVLLVVAGAGMVTGFPVSDPAIFYIFIAGEFLDRVFYYTDFEPVNIKSQIYKHLISSYNEK